MKNLLIYSVLILCTLFSACSIDEIESFGNEDYVYFDIDDNEGDYIDENGYLKQQFTFALEIDQTLTEKIVDFPVKIAGIPAASDRNFSVEIIDSLTTAIEGVHFDLVPETENFILSGEETGTFHLQLYKTEDLNTAAYKIAVDIVDNGIVNVGPRGKLILSVSNILEEPLWWEDHDYYLGYFTVQKARLWMIFHGVMDGSDPWNIEPYSEWVYLSWSDEWRFEAVYSKRMESIRLFALWLAKGDEDGNPYIDENGDEVLSTF